MLYEYNKSNKSHVRLELFLDRVLRNRKTLHNRVNNDPHFENCIFYKHVIISVLSLHLIG